MSCEVATVWLLYTLLVFGSVLVLGGFGCTSKSGFECLSPDISCFKMCDHKRNVLVFPMYTKWNLNMCLVMNCFIVGVPVYQVKSTPSSKVYNYLAEVTGHQGTGAGDLMSFVSLTGTSGGAPPSNELCDVPGHDRATTSVPFSGTFEFYNQDPQPPPVPAFFTPKGKFLQGSFCKGKVVYQFNGKRWLRKGVLATLYDVSGGNVIGKFGTITKADKFGGNLHFAFENPSFWVTGKLCARPLTVSTHSCPWQLMAFTSQGGTT